MIFLGVDVAGAANTWFCGLSPTNNGLALVLPPKKESLANIIRYAEEQHVLAAAIDAQLTGAISDETGFRDCDFELRKMLPSDCVNWVASQNSLMAVPVRGRQLADALSPVIGTILETHPRASLCFAFPELGEELRRYKDKGAEDHCRVLWQRWTERFGIVGDVASVGNDALDSLVCATIAYLFHREPEALHRLRHGAKDKMGRGVFYVLNSAN